MRLYMHHEYPSTTSVNFGHCVFAPLRDQHLPKTLLLLPMFATLTALILFALSGLYLLLIFTYLAGWFMASPLKVLHETKQPVSFSIIVPARNEAGNISACLRSILNQNYPSGLREIIVVDDCSEDNTAAIAEGLSSEIICLRMSNHSAENHRTTSHKKAALAAGISQAKGEVIITMDADCKALPEWLASLSQQFQQEAIQLVAAPVDFTHDNNLCGHFQSLDFMTMQGITAASHALKLGSMGNGANLSFRKAAYEAVDGYSGGLHLSSGDDQLLIAKIEKRFPRQSVYLKEKKAIVKTPAQPDWRAFFNQRIRWASKNGKYPDPKLTAILALVYAFNVSLAFATISLLFFPEIWREVVLVWAVKTVVELIFLLPVSAFFGKRKELLVFPILQPLHVAYICVAGFLGFFSTYTWKGRRVS